MPCSFTVQIAKIVNAIVIFKYVDFKQTLKSLRGFTDSIAVLQYVLAKKVCKKIDRRKRSREQLLTHCTKDEVQTNFILLGGRPAFTCSMSNKCIDLICNIKQSLRLKIPSN